MFKYKLLLIIVIAFLIRLIALNQSLWLDEATTAEVVKRYDYLGIITDFSVRDFHPPFYYLFMKFWTDIFGHGEIALRMPSVIFSLLTGWLVYLVGKRFYGDSGSGSGKTGGNAGMTKERVGLFSAALFLFNPLIVYYSQEARMYMMATMFLTGALYYFSKKNILLFSLFCAFAFFTFYGSVFLVAAFLFYFLYKKQYKNLFICLLVIFVYFLIISPLLYQQVINAKISLANVANWSVVLGKANLKNLLLIPVKFSIGRIDFYPKWAYYTTAGIWTLLIFSVLFKNLKLVIINSIKIKNFKFEIILFYLFVLPLFFGFMISFFTPLLQYFRFLYLIPILAILLSLSQGRVFILTAGFLAFSLVYLLMPQFHREDWKSLVKNLPESKPVYMITSSSDPLRYYSKKINIKDLADLNEMSTEAVDMAENMIVIPYTADIHGIDYKKQLEKKSYKLIDKKNFRGLELEYWTR